MALPNKVVFQIENSSYTINGKLNEADKSPFIENGRTYVPLREISYACGVTDEDIKWDSDTRTIEITSGDTKLNLKVGSKTLVRNGVTENIDVAPVLVRNRTYLPVRVVAEALGYEVKWDEKTKAVSICPPGEELSEVSIESLPEFKITNTDYTRQSFYQTLWNVPIHKEFAEKYSFSQNIQKQINDYITNKAVQNNIDINDINTAIDKIASYNKDLQYIICYIEKANYEGHASWLAVTNWGMDGEKLSHIQVFAIDALSGEILYFDTCR